MPESPLWSGLGDFVGTHQAQLVQRTAQQVCAQIPYFDTLPPDMVTRIFTDAYVAQAQGFAQENPLILRQFMEGIAARRLSEPEGGNPNRIIEILDICEGILRDLLGAEMLDPALTAPAYAQIRHHYSVARLAVSQVNLARLTGHTPAPRA